MSKLIAIGLKYEQLESTLAEPHVMLVGESLR